MPQFPIAGDATVRGYRLFGCIDWETLKAGEWGKFTEVSVDLDKIGQKLRKYHLNSQTTKYRLGEAAIRSDLW